MISAMARRISAIPSVLPVCATMNAAVAQGARMAVTMMMVMWFHEDAPDGQAQALTTWSAQ